MRCTCVEPDSLRTFPRECDYLINASTLALRAQEGTNGPTIGHDFSPERAASAWRSTPRCAGILTGIILSGLSGAAVYFEPSWRPWERPNSSLLYLRAFIWMIAEAMNRSPDRNFPLGFSNR